MGYFISFLIVSIFVGFVIYRVFEKPENEKMNKKVKYIVFSSIGAVVLIVGTKVGIETIKNTPSENPSFYDTENIEDMNEEELEDYLEWRNKQDNND